MAKSHTQFLRKGVKILEDIEGDGPPIQRQGYYTLAIRIFLSRGDVVRRPNACLSHYLPDGDNVDDDGWFTHRVRVDRENLVNGIFYALGGMQVGGYRRVEIAPHLAYGEHGVTDVIPKNALLTVEIKTLEELNGPPNAT